MIISLHAEVIIFYLALPSLNWLWPSVHLKPTITYNSPIYDEMFYPPLQFCIKDMVQVNIDLHMILNSDQYEVVTVIYRQVL